jgi:hypothetical protein
MRKGISGNGFAVGRTAVRRNGFIAHKIVD